MKEGVEPGSVFVLEGDVYHPTGRSVGPWTPDTIQGSASAGLLARALERVPQPTAMVLARLSFDLWRPVARHSLTVAVSVLRDGRKARTVEASLVQDAKPVARCTALFLRADPASAPPTGAPAASPPGPEAGRPIPERVRNWSPFFRGVDTRVIDGDLERPGPTAAWFTLVPPLVAGEENSSLVQTVSAADLASGISAFVDRGAWSYVNADLGVMMWRPPLGGWILVSAETRAGTQGTGLATGLLSDVHGPFGSCAQNLIFERARRRDPGSSR